MLPTKRTEMWPLTSRRRAQGLSPQQLLCPCHWITTLTGEDISCRYLELCTQQKWFFLASTCVSSQTPLQPASRKIQLIIKSFQRDWRAGRKNNCKRNNRKGKKGLAGISHRYLGGVYLLWLAVKHPAARMSLLPHLRCWRPVQRVWA